MAFWFLPNAHQEQLVCHQVSLPGCEVIFACWRRGNGHTMQTINNAHQKSLPAAFAVLFITRLWQIMLCVCRGIACWTTNWFDRAFSCLLSVITKCVLPSVLKCYNKLALLVTWYGECCSLENGYMDLRRLETGLVQLLILKETAERGGWYHYQEGTVTTHRTPSIRTTANQYLPLKHSLLFIKMKWIW